MISIGPERRRGLLNNSKMPTPEQEHFRRESARRFGALDDYVREKLDDKFPIEGNLKVAQYIGDFLEFLFKRYFIANLLSPQERQLLEHRDTTISRYLSDRTEGMGIFGPQRWPEFFDCDGREVAKIFELEFRLQQARPDFFRRIQNINLMDIGPAIGAISTMLALKVLDEYNLPDRVKIYLVDVSEAVLNKNTSASFGEEEYGGREKVVELFGSVESFLRLRECLKKATPICGAIDDGIDLPTDCIDITVANFLFHHIPGRGKLAAMNEIVRMTRGGIFVADEHFEDYQGEFGAAHAHDEIPLAPEQPISFRESLEQLSGQLYGGGGDAIGNQAYTYWGTKHSQNFYGTLTL